MMVNYKIIEILTMLCIINTTIAFNCWCCSSDDSDSKFCGKILDESKLTRYQKQVNLVHCTYPHHVTGRDLITKCMIQKTSNNGQTVYLRSCVHEDANAKNDSCMSLPPPYGHRTEACETCTEDKCNYLFKSDYHSDGSMQLMTVFKIMLICLVIALKI